MITQNNLIQIKPNLASSEKILPYLKAIDKNKYYSNFGPLYNLSCKKIIVRFLSSILKYQLPYNLFHNLVF